MPLQGSGEMSFADVYNEITGESLANPPISITLAELGQLQNSSGQTIALNQNYTPRPDGNLPTVFPTEWYLYCQRCNQASPYITITKSAPTSVNSGQEFAYRLTISNNGQTNSAGDIIVRDYIPNGLTFVRYERDTAAWGFSISGQQVTATFTSSLPVGFGAVITIYVSSDIQGTYSNYASVSGGGESITKTSNTVNTGVGAPPSWTSSVTKRLVRTFQKNNCDSYGIGSNVDVYSPYFTGTYTSFISQSDADTRANQSATDQCNQWLDANGQNEANTRGTCQYGYPQLTLSKSMPGAFNVNQSGQVTIIVRTFGNPTSGQIVITDNIPSGFQFVDMNSRPGEFSYSVNGNTIQFVTNSVLNDGYYGQFVFTVRANTIGNYTNVVTAYGGNILNNSATSNTVATYIFGNPTFAFSASTDNQTYYNGTSVNINAAPTDNIYHGNILTINTQDSTQNSIVKIEFELPIPFRIVDDTQVFYPTDYFTFSQGSSFNIAVFTQKNNITVPVGQYGFYVFFSIPITYFRMSTISQDENLRDEDNLIVDGLNITIKRKQNTLIRNYVNNGFISSSQQTIIWANNYTFLPIFQTTNDRIPSNVNGLTYSYSVNNQANYSQQYPMGFINQRFFASDPIYIVNPPRDTKNGALNVSYPYQDTNNFGIRIYYRIYQNGNLIVSKSGDYNPYDGITINRAYNEPKYRNTTFEIVVNSNGSYTYW